MNKPVTAWSYSRLSKYETCPYAFKLEFHDGIKPPQGKAAERGDAVHKGLAATLKQPPGVVTPEAKQAKKWEMFTGLFDAVKSLENCVEQQWGFGREFVPSTWFGKDVWYRAVLDVVAFYPDNHATVIDWKTGKKYGSYDDQAEQFALATFSRYKNVKSIDSRLEFVDSGEEELAEFTRADHPGLIEKWKKRAAVMFADTEHRPRPSDSCRFCHFRKSNSGPCAFG